MTTDQADNDPGPGPEVVSAEPATVDHYRQIYEAVALPVLMIDHESWNIVAVNEAAVRQYGYAREELLGMSALSLRPPVGRNDARKVLAEMPRGFWKASGVPHQRKDGSVFNADVWSRDAVVDGRAVRISTVSDVTERVQLQYELQQAQKMEAVGRLAGGIAHEFNNALTSIIGQAELLLEGVRDDQDAAHDVREILLSANRAASLTGQLLAFSRRQVMRIDVVPLNDVVLRADSLLRPLIGDRVELEARLDADTWAVQVDQGQLEQVILNLAVNAQDAMPDGGHLTLATRNVSLARAETRWGPTVPAGDYAELTVQDTGMGMDEITRTRVFEPFFTTKPAPEGTGLGLSMAYGIVRQSGGFITVDSAPGKGATFRILLPRAHQEAVLPRTRSPGSTVEDRGTVLVIEPEDAVRRLTCQVMEQLGFGVLSAGDGEEALTLVEAERPSLRLLVTDLDLPTMSGPELAERLAVTQPDLRVLFLSGYANEAVGDLGELVRGSNLLPKPFSIESLGEAARKILSEG